MNKTRKIPIILSSLAIVAGGLGQISPTLAIDNDLAANSIGGAENQLSLTKNNPDASLKINLIRYEQGEASGVVSVPEGRDWYIKKAVVAYMNYDQGVTEAEADENLATLDDSKNDDWLIVGLYNNYSVTKKTQNITLNQSTKDRSATANKSDVLYYAVEFGVPTESGTWNDNTWWERGKIDYRTCVHSSVFGSGMNCRLLEDEQGARYVPQIFGSSKFVFPPDGEEVLTWEDEWRNVILLNYEAVQNETELMGKYLNSGLAILDQNELTLDGVLKGVSKYPQGDSKLLWLPQGVEFWKGKIAELRKFYEKTDTSDTSSIEILQNENTTLKAEKAELQKENESTKMENLELRREIEEVRAENTSLKQEGETMRMENADLQQEKETLNSEVAALKQDNERLKSENVVIRQEKDDSERENSELRAENERLMAELAQMKNVNTEIAREKSEVEAENVKLKEEMMGLIKKNSELEKEKDGLVKENAEMDKLSAELTEQLASVQGVQTTIVRNECKGNDDNVSEVGLENNEEGIGGLQDFDKREDVNVPLLGEEVKTNGIWWWLIPVVGLVGVTILLIKRKLSRE